MFALLTLAACGGGVSPNQAGSSSAEGTAQGGVGTGREAVAEPEPENRNIDGTQNNLQHPEWGAAGAALARLADPAYADGISSPAGASRPNPREISNLINSQGGPIPNARGLSSYMFVWGQFLDHDLDLTLTDSSQPLPISVPEGDPYFDPQGTGTAVIPFSRSAFLDGTGTDASHPREQANALTAWLDASQVYGSDEARATWLRTGRDGKLKISEGNLLPFNDGSVANAPSASADFFVAGDIRVNEQTALAAIHTLFLREHNRLCDELKKSHPDWDDERIYQRARKFVGAFLQAITYQEFLPALLGPHRPGPDLGYDPEVDPAIFNEFSTAYFRVGHTMLNNALLRLGPDGRETASGALPLAEAFFNNEPLLSEGIDPLLRGLAFQPMQEIDVHVVDGVRNFLFGPPGAGGLDLASLNMQRGRDHGLPDYNTLRAALDLAPVKDFGEITSDPELASKLESIYGTVDQVDPWVGALAEDHLRGASVGPSIAGALKMQFERLRAGDRFWYERDPAFSREEVQEIHGTRLADILRRNTGIADSPDGLFRVAD
ncbi:MAG: peroxidase family protein [bacterium]